MLLVACYRLKDACVFRVDQTLDSDSDDQTSTLSMSDSSNHVVVSFCSKSKNVVLVDCSKSVIALFRCSMNAID